MSTALEVIYYSCTPFRINARQVFNTSKQSRKTRQAISMEPLSIVGAVSSIVSIIDVATRCISSLRALQQRWTGADWTVNLLVGQLVTLKAALDQIREWSATNLSTEPQHHQLVMDLDTSLESCRLLISVIDSHVSSLEWDEADTLTFESKMKAVWKDQSIQNCMNHLHHQTAALNLLLTALNWSDLISSLSSSTPMTNIQSLSIRPTRYFADVCKSKHH